MKKYQKGQTLEAVVLAIEPDRERISLGVKQMDSDPLATFATQFPKGSQVTGKVTEVDAKGAKIDLNCVEGYIRASELAYDRVEDARTMLSVGDELSAKFIGIDRKSRTISLSVKDRDVMPDEVENTDAGVTRSTMRGAASLGDLLKDIKR